jgi:hypothetical protein
VEQVLVLLAVSGSDGIGLREPQDGLLFSGTELLPSGFRRALMCQDSLQRREAECVISNGSFHGRENIGFGIGMQQCQYLCRLVLDIPLLGQQPCKEARAGFAKLSESFTQSLHLSFMVFGRRMRGIHAPLASLALEEGMPGDWR